ncbi:hypothetical protein L210DRAFT_3658277 [Boletus edulis BED1]|uniref:Uncharacterized protein n=1 Tax=Boletus edulis BED1 TaxID=1328754 RepID=A0AAD4G5B2_BOLED|nr:hypothetical protein L210DRAFT_3658277 [Boletus edulis BED1]
MEEDELQSDQEEQPVASGSSPSKLAKLQHSAERQKKKQKRMADEGQLHAKRHEMDKAKAGKLDDEPDDGCALQSEQGLPSYNQAIERAAKDDPDKAEEGVRYE